MYSWITAAEKEIGVHEISGAQAEPKIIQYWKDAGLDPAAAAPAGDETPWCAAFVGAMLSRGGISQLPHTPLAKGFMHYGTPVNSPIFGCIAVLNREGGKNSDWQGHTGFVIGFGGGYVVLINGNAGNKVCIARFPISRVAAYRWPPGAGIDPSISAMSHALPAVTNPSDR